jgi:hypothetical protein
LAKAQTELTEAQSATGNRLAQVMDLYTRMRNIVISHEERISASRTTKKTRRVRTRRGRMENLL